MSTTWKTSKTVRQGLGKPVILIKNGLEYCKVEFKRVKGA